MSSAQRIAVWNGERAHTTGGLKKADLMRNRHGRIVSKRKSEVARRLNNLGNFLANKAKGAKKPAAEPKPKPKPAAVKPKPKPKPVAVKPKPKPKPVAVKPKPKPKLKPKPKPVAVDPALIPPKIDKRLKKKPIPKKKKLDFGFGPIDLTGGRLRKVTQKQLDRAKKKPIPRRAKKKRTRRKPSMGLMV